MRSRVMGGLVLALALAGAAAQRPGGPPPGPPPGGGMGGPPPGGGRPGGPPPPGPGGNAPGTGSASSGTAANGHTAPRFGPVGRWWDDRAVVQTVGISRDQQKKMDTIFDANKPAILAAYKTFLARQAAADALGKQSQVDQAKMFAAIDEVNQARAALEKANTQMLLQIRATMTPAQIGRLETLP